MNDQGLIKITEDDIAEANRLSLSCPICAGAVEKNVDGAALAPVLCANCHTLYHHSCWQQNGNKCATLGCGNRQSIPYDRGLGPRLKIDHKDILRHPPQPALSPNGRHGELKAEQRREAQQANRDFWNGLLRRILRAFRWR